MFTKTRDSIDSIVPPSAEPSQEIIAVVAEAKGVDPIELEPLYDVLDPDALDALLESGDDADLELSFEYADVRVVVTADVISVDG